MLTDVVRLAFHLAARITRGSQKSFFSLGEEHGKIKSGQEAGVRTAPARMDFGKIERFGLRKVRFIVLLLGGLNGALIAAAMAVAAVSKRSGCPQPIAAAAGLVVTGAIARTIWMWVIGFVQVTTASTMLAEEVEPDLTHVTVLTRSIPSRHKRRAWYRCWVWWTRIGHLVTAVQVFAASYMTYLLVESSSFSGSRPYTNCSSSGRDEASSWLHTLFVIVPVAAWVLVIGQCCAGPNILTWRSLYQRRTEAWRAHYHEMFDHGIREVLCCLGRSQYMDVLEKEEVDSVAALLGDLVAYRAEGPSHLEFLAGVALLREETPKSPVSDEFPAAPASLLLEATRLHPYAVAAYTGPLLDVGRHRATFLCAWLYRQGVCTAWNRKRRPQLDGDNWWRGHASAFLRHLKIPETALRKGRVRQTNREAVYFVVVLHDMRTVVVTVRGTETPEDLITDGLGKECTLSDSDMQGLLESQQIPESVRHEVASSKPHFGHIGVVAAARELAMQLDGHLEDNDRDLMCTDGSRNVIAIADDKCQHKGLLSTLLGPGGECEGYALRFVGHSLGGAIASLTALRLYNRFPSLHVYAYGVLPCLDAAAAEACSSFVTSIVYNDEFSSRLSVAAIIKLREKALVKLKAVNADSAVIMKLWRCWGSQRPLETDQSGPGVQHGTTSTSTDMSLQQFRRRLSYSVKGGIFLCSHGCRCLIDMPKLSPDLRVQRRHEGMIHDVCKGGEPSLSGKSNLQVQLTKVCSVLHLAEDQSNGNTTVMPCSNSNARNDKSNRPDCDPEIADRGVRGFDAGGDSRSCEEGQSLLLTATGTRQNSGSALGLQESDVVKDSLASTSLESAVEQLWPAEMFIPGLVVHVTCDHETSLFWSPWKRSSKRHNQHQHRAVLRDRTHFRDIIVSPSMFLDHLPWRCQHALNDIVGQIKSRSRCEPPDLLQSRITDYAEIV